MTRATVTGPGWQRTVESAEMTPRELGENLVAYYMDIRELVSVEAWECQEQVQNISATKN